MTSLEPVQLVGGTGSPYTQKMVALLRYRRIPYAITWGQPETTCEALGVEAPKPTFMPTFFFEEGGELTAHCDSTPIIRRLEADHAGRSVLPADPALAFIDYLIEDFADEWCTKYMFHYRWHFEADADNAGTKLPLSMDVSMPQEAFQQFKDYISQRQIERLWVVGSNEETAPIIDASYRRFLAAMEAHLANQPFMLGRRPGAGDFGLFGQLSQLVGFDPHVAGDCPRGCAAHGRLGRSHAGWQRPDARGIRLGCRRGSAGEPQRDYSRKSGGSIRRRNSRMRKP